MTLSQENKNNKLIMSLSSRRMLCFIDSIEAYVVGISHLLYYDALLAFHVFPSTRLDDKRKLVDSGLIVDGQLLFDENDRKAIRSDIEWFTSHTIKDLMDCSDKAMKFVTGNVRRLALKARQKGAKATPYYSVINFDRAFEVGNDKVLSVIYQKLPTLDESNLDMDYLIDFLKDEETQVKRRRLFSWQNDIETKIEKGEIKIEYLPDLIATNLDDYTQWIEKNNRGIKKARREFMLYASLSFLGGLSVPTALKKYCELKERKLHLLDDEKAPGRELAYIDHAKRKFNDSN